MHDYEGWWLAITVAQASGAAVARAGTIAQDGAHRALRHSMPAPAEDTDALVLAITSACDDLDGTASWYRERLCAGGTVPRRYLSEESVAAVYATADTEALPGITEG